MLYTCFYAVNYNIVFIFCNSENDWDILWCDVGWMRENFDHFYLQEHVKLCHFRNHYEVSWNHRPDFFFITNKQQIVFC
jgi:hypothetical protein